jgi:hypothetical protein
MTGSPRRARLRTARLAVAGAAAAIGVMALGVGSAQAATQSVPMTFDDGALKLGGSGSALDIIDAGAPAVMTADVCTDTAGSCTGKTIGDFTVPLTPATNFSFAPFTAHDVGISGQDATVDLIPLANITGHYAHATGAMTTNASNYSSSIVLSGALTGNCTVSPISLAFSTANTTPFLGDAFDPIVTVLPGPPVHGVIDASWSTLPTPTGTGSCSSVLSAFTNGPGGIALANGMAPVCPGCTPPSSGGTTGAPAPVAPKKKKCKKKKSKKSASSSKKSKCKKKKKK